MDTGRGTNACTWCVCAVDHEHAAQVYAVEVNHKPPETFSDKLVLALVKGLRFSFDVLAGFKVRE
jgi:hypothetical protein